MVTARGSKGNRMFYQHIAPFELCVIKSALRPKSLVAVSQLVAIHHLVLNTLINQGMQDR